MAERIRIDTDRCRREGWRTFGHAPRILAALGCSLVALTGVALAASHTGYPLWIVLAATTLTLGGPALAAGALAQVRQSRKRGF